MRVLKNELRPMYITIIHIIIRDLSAELKFAVIIMFIVMKDFQILRLLAGDDN